jgi:predicted metal-dependent peptidase
MSDAKGRLLKARLQLMLDEPYLASAIARLPIVDASGNSWCELIATDGYYIYYNAREIETVEAGHLPFLIAHEVLHCVLGHIDRRSGRDRRRWNLAIDYATNLMLVDCGMVMPPFGLIDERYRGLSADEIYLRLGADANDANQALDQPSGRALAHRPSAKRLFPDAHIDPGDLEGADHRETYFPSPAERRRLQTSLAGPIEHRLQGVAPGRYTSEVEAAKQTRVPWQHLLARFVSGLRRSNYRMWPPHRKHIWRDLYLPSVGEPGPSLLVVAIDTSGSMSDSDISEILGEIDGLRSATPCRLAIVQCDAEVRHREVFEPYEEASYSSSSGKSYRVYGRGGTDFRPVFRWVLGEPVELEGRPDALIYCTDGFGTFPKEEPPFPVLWIASGERPPKFPFGDTVYLRDGAAR